jgi:hypothetical protein
MWCFFSFHSHAYYLESNFKNWRSTSESIIKDSSTDSQGDRIYAMDEASLRKVLLSEQQATVISVPLPNGELIDFTLTASNVVAEALSRKYPEIKTFVGVQVNHPKNKGRFDITPNGFHGMFYYEGDLVFIEPNTQLISTVITKERSITAREFNKVNTYRSYQHKKVPTINRERYQFHQPKLSLSKSSLVEPLNHTVTSDDLVTAAKSIASTSNIKTYRLAISAAAEYTEFNGGSVDSAMAEIITLVNRLNEVFQRDLAIKLELVADNDLLVFTDADQDPFANTSNDGDINTEVINGIIGSQSYDIGHVVGTGGGGLAVLESVCSSQSKGDGVTGSNIPNNDAFYIDYVAHEIAHQFGANHSFNGTSGACSGNRTSSSAYEVGSGSTIMSYAGICGSQNLQNNSDAFFHSNSIEEITSFVIDGRGRNCGSFSNNINNTAIVDAGDDYVIPARTPFVLTGTATDVDSTNLSYSWEQFDLGSASNHKTEQVDDGFRPLFRVFAPVNNGERTFPTLDSLLTNSSTIGEVLPTTDREMNFRLLVRDGEGGVSFDASKVTVIDTGESFSVISPELDDTWSNDISTISWKTAETDQSPINCSLVDVMLSQDGGENFTQLLAEDINNSGSADILLANFCASNVNTDRARIKVSCSDNIFFAINTGDFIINKSINAFDAGISSQQTLSMNQGESLTITSSMFSYNCETPESLTVEEGEGYSVIDNTITPDSNFSGQLNISVKSNQLAVSSETFIAIVTVNAEPEIEVPQPTVPEESVNNTSSSGSVFWLLFSLITLTFRQNHFKNLNSTKR